MIRAADYVSLRWSEEKSLGGRACYKHLAPNGAKSNNDLLHFQVEFANEKSGVPFQRKRYEGVVTESVFLS
jgi:hypothetical protein